MKKSLNPPMHTVEHILNQTMNRMFDCARCFNARIKKKKSKCDDRFDRPLSAEQIQDIQTKTAPPKSPGTIIPFDLE